jgi:hypothetical protein
MTTENFTKALQDAETQLRQAIFDRNRTMSDMNAKILQLQNTVKALRTLLRVGPTSSMDIAESLGLTDAVRSIVRKRFAGCSVTAAQVRDQLLLEGFDLSHYKNALGAVHTVLVRLARSGGLIMSKPRSPSKALTFQVME